MVAAECFSGHLVYPFLVLNFGFDIVDRITRFNLEGDGFSSQRFDEDLHRCCFWSLFFFLTSAERLPALYLWGR